MKARKMFFRLTAAAMLAGFVFVGQGNLYADEQSPKAKIEKIETLVADLRLSNTQNEKYQDFKSSLQTAPAKKKELNLEFVNKLITIPVF